LKREEEIKEMTLKGGGEGDGGGVAGEAEDTFSPFRIFRLFFSI
jgi:hypothetical protein